jgi:hypothetical protein
LVVFPEDLAPFFATGFAFAAGLRAAEGLMVLVGIEFLKSGH